jgi:hypothetical protein
MRRVSFAAAEGRSAPFARGIDLGQAVGTRSPTHHISPGGGSLPFLSAPVHSVPLAGAGTFPSASYPHPIASVPLLMNDGALLSHWIR